MYYAIVYHCGKKQIDPFTKLFKNASTFVRPAFKKSKFLLNFDKSASAEWLQIVSSRLSVCHLREVCFHKDLKPIV